MNTRITGWMLAALALAGWVAAPAMAGDDPAPGGTSKPAGDGKEGKCGDGKEGEKKCPCCGEGDEGAEGKECCKDKDKVALHNRLMVALAAVEGESEAAKNILGQVPEKAKAAVEEARKATFEYLVSVQKEVDSLKKDFEASCEEAKAKGKDVCCDMKATYEHDVKELQAKATERLGAFAKTLDETLGSEKVQSLAAEAKKLGEAAKSCMTKVQAAASKLLGSVKKCEAEEDDDEGDEADDEAKEKPEQKPAGKDAK